MKLPILTICSLMDSDSIVLLSIAVTFNDVCGLEIQPFSTINFSPNKAPLSKHDPKISSLFYPPGSGIHGKFT